jgi:hypothetical protein
VKLQEEKEMLQNTKLQLSKEVLNKKTFIPIKPKNPIGRLQKVLQMTLLPVLATTSNPPHEQP